MRSVKMLKKGRRVCTVRGKEGYVNKSKYTSKEVYRKDRAHYIGSSKEADMNFKKPSRKDQSVNKFTGVLFHFYNLFYGPFMCEGNK